MGHGQNRLRVQKVLAELQNGDLNREDFDALAAGYYEGLQKNAGHLGMPAERDDVRFRDDFLLYEFKPNVRQTVPGRNEDHQQSGHAESGVWLSEAAAYPAHRSTRRLAFRGAVRTGLRGITGGPSEPGEH